jgi:hypothetical protein
MKHSPQAPESLAAVDQDGAGDSASALTRRKFITLLGAGATSLAVQACGGGGGGGVVPTPVTTSPTSGGSTSPTPTTPPVTTPPTTTPSPAAPVWSIVPAIVFTQGVKSSISMKQWIASDPAAVSSMTLNALALPPGVSFNAATMSLDYDGAGAPALRDGYILTANG